MRLSFRRKGMSIFPVLAVGFVLASLLIYLVSVHSGPNPEEQTRNQLAAVSAVNRAALSLRQAGTIPPEQVISSDGVNVTVTSKTSPDGNTISIVAQSGSEVTTAKAIRTSDPVAAATPAVTAAPTPAATPAPASGLVPNPVVQKYLSGTGVYIVGRDAATGEYRAYTNGHYIVLVRDANGKMTPAENQPFFPPVPATSSNTPVAPTPAAPTVAQTAPAKWVIYDSENKVISADSASRDTNSAQPTVATSPAATSPQTQPATIRIVSRTAPNP